ncbi:NadR type nicotinamide-nucleotide adenylyltransferase [Sphingomonas kyeonggiensis]|uniref:AAA family ATPase n=1 Tax=Sphingomonas kyeonggiensis TaxID=1268553 RepID=UPI0027872FCB|nr:AAA family ATPase [Sphingomonas kyeonggiensis]MDQ0252185.1 NadR type nicotinamide-nucleotide adenylyltransferase [Sphingomonas kyeonggiensis]
MTRGFLLGKFMPPHNGHVLLCETAAALVDELTILVCWLPDDPVPGPLRLQWMRELFPRARVIGHDAVVPQAPEEHPDFWPIWRGIVRSAHPEPIDLVFASEDYGQRLAAEVGARFHPVDPGRKAVPVSASAIRADPWGQWHHLPAPVKPHYAQTICLHGPESTGKSQLAAHLARHFGTQHVPEFGRTWCDWRGTDLAMDDLLAIAATHDAMTRAALRQCNRRLVLDTDPLMTAVWAEMLFGRRDPWFDAWQGAADLYLLLDIDLPWIQDGTRFFGEEADRRRFFELCRAELDRRGVRWVLVSGIGEARSENALAAISAEMGSALNAFAISAC